MIAGDAERVILAWAIQHVALIKMREHLAAAAAWMALARVAANTPETA